MSLNGKIALVSGAASGIGRATAELLAERGIQALVLLDLQAGPLQAVAEALQAQGTAVFSCVADIADRAALAQALRPALQQAGRIDLLTNCAGIAQENAPEQEDVWHRVIDVNVNGTYHVTLEALACMPDGGRIVNVSSILGRYGRIRNTAYCASKHAILGFTKSLALDLALRRITVNAVLPGSVDTPMFRRELALEAEKVGLPPEQLLRSTRKKVPLRRLVEAREVAQLIAFLASDEAAAITAQSYVIDGGLMMGA